MSIADVETPAVAVVGATGRQGGAAARALLSVAARVRALTRDPESSAGRELCQAGAEVVAADLDKPETATVAAATGRPARYEAVPLEVLADNRDQQSMFAWLGRRPADKAARARELVPEVWDLRTCLGNQ